MSGICGVIYLNGAPIDPAVLRAISEKAPYRGPAGVEYWLHGSIGLAYLASQPASIASIGLYSGGGLVVAADARLDNQAELAHLLAAKGCLLAGAPTDGELILAAFACWGAACSERLQGAYSLACWNEADASLILVRDRLGERPLYWCSMPQALYFASEPAQLLAVDSIDPAPNLERHLAHLLKQPFDPTWSFFRNIQRLPEAHFLLCKDHRATLQRYWSPQGVPQRAWPRHEAAEALSQSLEQAVARRLSKDVETGVLLSGGLDSSSVAAKAAALLERQAKQLFAFTWESRSGDLIDERKWSAVLVERRQNIVERPVLADELYPLSRYPEAYADPNAPDTNTYPDLLLTTIESAQRSGVRVLMNGMGGDLMIGGVLPELALLRQGHLGVLTQRLWQSKRQGVKNLARQVKAAYKADLPAWITPQGHLLIQKAALDRPAISAKAYESQSKLRQHVITATYNAMNLERFDRLSSRQQVRIMAPWYDQDLVLLILSLEDGALDLHPPGKSLLREALASELPDELRAMPIPKGQASHLPSAGLNRNARELIEGWLRRSILGQWGMIDSARALSDYRQAAQAGRIMSKLWELITLEIWLQLHYNEINP